MTYEIWVDQQHCVGTAMAENKNRPKLHINILASAKSSVWADTGVTKVTSW